VGSTRKGIKTIPQLRGKKIASQLGSQTDYVFQNKIMPAFGMKKGDYQVINTKFADHASAMASGSVDAFAGVEPYPSVAELGGFGTVLTNYMKYDIVPVLLGTNRTVLTTRTDDLVKFMKGWQLAIDIFKKDRKYAAKTVGDFFRGRGYKMNDEIFARAMSTMDVTTTYRPEVKGYLTTKAETLVKLKRLDAVPNIGAALDERILKAAM
jgi:ABC-type nitrate/sulfonate/bicarbonate transport system substrate-binding protein